MFLIFPFLFLSPLICVEFLGLLRLQQIYQGLRPGNETFQVETVKRIANATNAIDFLKTLEELNRWSRKYIVLDCPTDMAKDIVVYHVRDLSLGRRTYHYLLSGLVSSSISAWSPFYFFFVSFLSFFPFFCYLSIPFGLTHFYLVIRRIWDFFFCDFIPLYDYYYYTIGTNHIR